MTISDLWPDDITAETDLIMPVTILREQAAALTKRMKGLVEAEVRTMTPRDLVREFGDDGSKDTFFHEFMLVAPALDSYAFTLFSVIHNIHPYPIRFALGKFARGGDALKLQDQEAFIDQLREVFSSADTKGKIQTLVAQSRS